jgi:hypothetical protein
MIPAQRRAGRARVLVGAVALALALPAAASADPPSNDARAAAQDVTLPATVDATTAESTLEAEEPFGCAPLRGSVFYELRAPSDDRIVVRLDAAGDLDATVDVFRRVRSQLEPVECDQTDRRGDAGFQFRPVRGGTYLIRVGQRDNSVAGRFRLDVFAPVPAPRPPGPRLPGGGVSRTLDSLQDTSDAWSVRMRAGRTYRLNLAAGPCMRLRVFGPGTRDFEAGDAVASAGCDGYLLFTPRAGQTGRYSLLVDARPRRSGPQRYRLQAARAGADDTAPGVPLPNYRRVRAKLNGGTIDSVDLYRFSLSRRSALDLSLRHSTAGGIRLSLHDDRGKRLESGDAITSRIAPGRYFVAVRTRSGASGRYTLRRVTRTITQTAIAIEGRRRTQARPGEALTVSVAVRPAVPGPVAITIERFDPLAGWQFHSRVRTPARRIAFLPPTIGRWRARAAFEGTRADAPSESGYARVLVAKPLGGAMIGAR